MRGCASCRARAGPGEREEAATFSLLTTGSLGPRGPAGRAVEAEGTTQAREAKALAELEASGEIPAPLYPSGRSQVPRS